MSKNLNQPYVSVDTVPLRLTAAGLEVLLAERWKEPFAGSHALPGVLLLPGESIKDAAIRALEDKTDIVEGVNADSIIQIGVFDDANRDPRGATLSISVFVFPTATETSGKWVKIDEVGELPFDHNTILQAGRRKLENPQVDLVAGIFGDTFTSGEYALLVESAGSSIDRTNLSRIIESRLPVSKVGMATSPLTKRRGTQWELS